MNLDLTSTKVQIASPSDTQSHLTQLAKNKRSVDNETFYRLTGREPESHKRIQSLAQREYRTQRPIADLMLELFTSHGVVRKDFAKWWPTIGDEPFVGEVNGCPNMRGMMLATNGIDGFVSVNGREGFFCHFSNFILDDTTQQGKMNCMVMPFKMWLKNEEMRRIVAREKVARAGCKAANASPVTNKRANQKLDREKLLSLFA